MVFGEENEKAPAKSAHSIRTRDGSFVLENWEGYTGILLRLCLVCDFSPFAPRSFPTCARRDTGERREAGKGQTFACDGGNVYTFLVIIGQV